MVQIEKFLSQNGHFPSNLANFVEKWGVGGRLGIYRVYKPLK